MAKMKIMKTLILSMNTNRFFKFKDEQKNIWCDRTNLKLNLKSVLKNKYKVESFF